MTYIPDEIRVEFAVLYITLAFFNQNIQAVQELTVQCAERVTKVKIITSLGEIVFCFLWKEYIFKIRQLYELV